MAKGSWICPECGRDFGHVRQAHACAPPTPFESHFRRSEPLVKELALSILGTLRKTRVPHKVVPVKTRILVRGKRVFLVLIPKKDRLEGELVLSGPAQHRTFGRAVPYVRGTLVHHFRLTGKGDLDASFRIHLKEAALIGAA
jgi:hypothetical protein